MRNWVYFCKAAASSVNLSASARSLALSLPLVSLKSIKNIQSTFLIFFLSSFCSSSGFPTSRKRKQKQKLFIYLKASANEKLKAKYGAAHFLMLSRKSKRARDRDGHQQTKEARFRKFIAVKLFVFALSFYWTFLFLCFIRPENLRRVNLG